MGNTDVESGPEQEPLGDAQLAVLQKRLAEHELSPQEVLTREQVLAEARQR